MFIFRTQLDATATPVHCAVQSAARQNGLRAHACLCFWLFTCMCIYRYRLETCMIYDVYVCAYLFRIVNRVDATAATALARAPTTRKACEPLAVIVLVFALSLSIYI